MGITVYYFVVLVWLAAIGQYLGTVVMGKMMTFSSLTGVVVGSLGVIQ
jgi:flagellar protein FlaJ